MKKKYTPYLVIFAVWAWIVFLVLWIAIDPNHGVGPRNRDPSAVSP